MSFATFNEKIEKHILPLANKLSSQRHLKAIRDAFISLMPITPVSYTHLDVYKRQAFVCPHGKR